MLPIMIRKQVADYGGRHDSKTQFQQQKNTLEFLLSEMEYMMGEVSLTEGSEVKFWTYCV